MCFCYIILKKNKIFNVRSYIIREKNIFIYKKQVRIIKSIKFFVVALENKKIKKQKKN